MTGIPDSGDPGNVFDGLGFEKHDDRITEATWQHLCQKYRISAKPLGRGGQAIVFAVEEIEAPHRRLAIKVYLENTDAARRAFDNEARVLSSDRLPPEVVGFFQCVTEPGIQQYLVLEFIDGQPLTKLATAKRKLSRDRQLDLGKRLARAVQRLHQSNLVFGDLSANNVLVEEDGSGDIRFVDLAGAKELIKGHGRLRSSVNMVTPGFIPQTQAESEVDSALINAARTNLGTDIYAVTANLFFQLTGRTEAECRGSISSRDAASQWDAALRAAGVPRGIRRIVLKGLRVADDRTGIDPRVYPSAEAIADDLDAWETARVRRRSAVTFGLPALICVCVLAFVAQLGWRKYEAERLAHDVRTLEDLQRQVERLDNVTEPGIAALIEQTQSPLPGDSATGRADVAAVRDRIALLRQALSTSRDLAWAQDIRQSLGEVLLKSPWLTTAKKIAETREDLLQRYRDLEADIAAGKTDNLQDRFAQLHRDLADLAEQNTQAAPAEQKRLEFDRLARSVADELRQQDGCDQIVRSATDARGLLDRGQWHDAELQFGSCTQRLSDWLAANESPAQQSARRRADQDTLAALEAEKAQLQADVERVNETHAAKDAEIAKLNANLATLGTDAATARRAKDAAELTLKQEQAKLAAVQKQFDTADRELKQARLDLAAAGPKLTELDSATARLTEATRKRDELQKSVAALTGQVAIWKAAAEKNPGQADTLKAAQEAARLQAQIDQADTDQLYETQAAFTAAVQRYRSLEAERDNWVRINRPKETNATLKSKNDTLAAAGTQLEAALAKLDAAHQKQFATRQPAIAAAETSVVKARAGFDDDSPLVIRAQAVLKTAQAAQQPFAAGAARAAGTGPKLALEEILAQSAAAAVAGTQPGDLKEIPVKGVVTRWRWIPAGTFRMGSPANEAGRSSDEDGADGKPVEVTLTQGFWMLETEVTQELWTAVMGSGLDWDNYGKGPKYPVYNVSHDEAVSFCAKFNTLLKSVSGAEGLAVRLPTEAEWEYAARARTTTRYYWGDRDEDADAYAWHAGNSDRGTHPVGTKKPNAWGLYDMSGSVWEYCADGYDDELAGGTDPRGPSRGSFRVYRGGSWFLTAQFARSASRNWGSPDFRHSSMGFRVLRSSVLSGK